MPPPIAEHPGANRPVPQEPNGYSSRLLSIVGYSLLVAVLLLSAATADAIWSQLNSATVKNSIGMIGENAAYHPSLESSSPNRISETLRSDRDTVGGDPFVSQLTIAVLRALPRLSDDQRDVLPLQDVRQVLPLVQLGAGASPRELASSHDDVETTMFVSVHTAVSNPSAECKDGTCPAPLAGTNVDGEHMTVTDCSDGKCPAPRTLGTLIDWAPTAEHAGEIASKEGKLVFLMQVSGNFARQEFT